MKLLAQFPLMLGTLLYLLHRPHEKQVTDECNFLSTS